MRVIDLIPFLLGSAAAATPSQPSKPFSSASVKKAGDAPGGDATHLDSKGPWHWKPSKETPKGWNSRSKRDDCIQIQNEFPAGTNGDGSESATRAAAVKVLYF